jgi:hypothetical protein
VVKFFFSAIIVEGGGVAIMDEKGSVAPPVNMVFFTMDKSGCFTLGCFCHVFCIA